MSEQEPQRIPTDGSYGAGPNAELTIYTKNPDGGRREETFTVPYYTIDFAKLVLLDSLHLILGYSVCKMEKPDRLKDLGLA
jgi:hypothetical protein